MQVRNLIAGEWKPARAGEWFDKVSPVTGDVLSQVARSRAEDVGQAVDAAREAQAHWARTPAVQRGMALLRVVRGMEEQQERIARTVAEETGKSYRDALGETAGAIALGLFFASEGQRLYGRTTTSAVPNRHAMTLRQPVGVAGLIVPANTPIANVAWKVFPALVCGNTAVLKAAEDTPATAAVFGEIADRAELPKGVLNIVQGYGAEAGAPLVEHPEVGVVSFTGSTAVGKQIQRVAGERLAKVSLELGGKNPFVVCDDAELDNAVKWAFLSAFSNAGQRCAAGSRLIVDDAVYERFRDLLLERTVRARVGPRDEDDFGPVINGQQLGAMLASLERAKLAGARVLCGGYRLTDPEHQNGFYLAPTLIEGAAPHDEISTKELFGPIACLYRARSFEEALALANSSIYGLTASIHTRSLHRAMVFTERVHAGVVMVNAGTYGSEPHMPFGGVRQSGNGSREPGTEALDIYSYIKDLYINVDPTQV